MTTSSNRSNGVAVNYAGNVPINVPQNVSNIWLTWAFAPQWSADAGVQIVGKDCPDNANTMTRPAYNVVNAGVQWKPDAQHDLVVPRLQSVRRDLHDVGRHHAVDARDAAHRAARGQREVLTVARALKRTLRRWLYIGHRWVGIVTCLFFAMWFVSGVVMMYVAFPGLSDKERLAALPDIPWEKVELAPDRIMSSRRHALSARPPAFHAGRRAGVSDNRLGRQTAGDLCSRWPRHQRIPPNSRRSRSREHHPAMPVPQLDGTIDRDQWSVTARYDPLRPLYLIALGDNADTKLYISSRSGEIALDTNRTERVWNWLGSIPHWIYPTVLRKDGPLWRLVVLWISGICLIVGVTGIWIGILRVRLKPRYSGNGITPYRGWMAWHHVTGLIAGIFVLTWMFSGWLSLNPGEYFASRNTTSEVLQRYAGHDAPTSPRGFCRRRKPPRSKRALSGSMAAAMMLADRNGVQTSADPTTGTRCRYRRANFAAARRAAAAGQITTTATP